MTVLTRKFDFVWRLQAECIREPKRCRRHSVLKARPSTTPDSWTASILAARILAHTYKHTCRNTLITRIKKNVKTRVCEKKFSKTSKTLNKNVACKIIHTNWKTINNTIVIFSYLLFCLLTATIWYLWWIKIIKQYCTWQCGQGST